MKTAGQLLVVAAIALLAAIVARELFPRTVIEYRPSPPVQPDTVPVVDSAAIVARDAVIAAQTRRIAELEARQPQNVIHTVYVEPEPTRIEVCEAEQIPPRWYLRAITTGGAYGDTAVVAVTHLSSDGGSVLLRPETATAFQTGPLLGATSDSTGYQLLFDPDGFPDEGCQLGCKAKIAAAFTALGVVLKTLFGG